MIPAEAKGRRSNEPWSTLYIEGKGLYILAERHSLKLFGDLLLTSSQETA